MDRGLNSLGVHRGGRNGRGQDAVPTSTGTLALRRRSRGLALFFLDDFRTFRTLPPLAHFFIGEFRSLAGRSGVEEFLLVVIRSATCSEETDTQQASEQYVSSKFS